MAQQTDYPAWQTGVLRYPIPFVIYMIFCFLAIGFCRCTGAVILFIGMKVRNILPPELAHVAFCFTLRWWQWMPAWVDEARRLEERR